MKILIFAIFLCNANPLAPCHPLSPEVFSSRATCEAEKTSLGLSAVPDAMCLGRRVEVWSN